MNSTQCVEKVQGLQEYDSPWEELEEAWHRTRLLGSGIFKAQALSLLQDGKVPGDKLGYPSPAFLTPGL